MSGIFSRVVFIIRISLDFTSMRQHIQKTRISNWQKLISPFFNWQFYLIQCNSMSIHSIQFQSIQFNEIQFNSMSTLLIQCQTIQFNVNPFNSVSTHSIQCQPFKSMSTHSIQFQPIQFNFNPFNSISTYVIQCHPIQFISGAPWSWYCPCYEIWGKAKRLYYPVWWRCC